MRRALGISTAALVAALVLGAAAACAEEVTRESFVAQAESTCEGNKVRLEGILNGARERIRNDRLRPAGAQFIRASTAFGDGIRQLVAIPRPPADNERLLKWFKFLRIVKGRLLDVGKALKEENKIRYGHETIRAERSSNAANNVSFVFEFRSCRLTRSQFE